jgi:hypothetical protein
MKNIFITFAHINAINNPKRIIIIPFSTPEKNIRERKRILSPEESIAEDFL